MKHTIFSLLIIFFLTSCKKNYEKDSNEIIGISKNGYKDLKYKMKFPDTIMVNKSYKAIIEFESSFDIITPSVHVDPTDTTKVRLITFYHFKPVRSPMKSKGNLILIDSTFVTNKSFEIDNIVFSESGEFVFCGLIKDVIMYNHYDKKGIRDSVHFEELNQQIFKKIVVIDN